MITGIQKSVLLEALNKIYNSTFSTGDVMNVLISLRDHTKNSTFIEIANFVAHPNRNKGELVDSLNFYLYKSLFVHEYVFTKTYVNDFNLRGPFPAYVIEMMKYIAQVKNRIDLDRTDLTENDYLSFVKNHFEPTYGEEYFQLKNSTCKRMDANSKPRLSRMFNSLVTAIQHLHGPPKLTQTSIIDSILVVLEENQITLDQSKFLEQQGKIMLCMLLLLHNVTYTLHGSKTLTTNIEGVENGKTLSIGCDVKSGQHIPKVTNRVETGITIFNLVTTTLKARDWCDTSLLTGINPFLDHNYTISADYKLITDPNIPYTGKGVIPMDFRFVAYLAEQEARRKI